MWPFNEKRRWVEVQLNSNQKRVFREIYAKRTVSRSDLSDHLRGVGIDEPTAKRAVTSLARQHLITVRPGVLSDLDTLMVTAKGFELATADS
jgi:DNA-binding MarR family transcriptional regulator